MFHDSGKYCVNVGVMNDVSGTNTSLVVQIPGKLSIYTNVDPDLTTSQCHNIQQCTLYVGGITYFLVLALLQSIMELTPV